MSVHASLNLHFLLFFFLMIRRPPRSTLFPLHDALPIYGRVGGISFPDDDEPDYWDFAYFAFTIGMCAQVSDATISSKTIRRTALSHSIASFVFTAALLALPVNTAPSPI